MKKYICNFDQARSYTRKLGLKNFKEWVNYCGSGKKPREIPSNPNRTYKNHGWVDYKDWLDSSNNKYGKKYSVNDGFFKVWSHDMAYILGLWWADGCICGTHESRFVISLHKNDVSLLLKIKEIMGATHPIRYSRDMSSLVIDSKEIYKDIISFGGMQRKSLLIDFPKIPREFLRDFIRGLWDGDGTIYYLKKEGDYMSSIMSGSELLITKLFDCIKQELPEIKGSVYHGSSFLKKNNKIYPNRFSLQFGLEGTRKLCKYLGYKEENILALERKRQLFLKTKDPKEYVSYNKATEIYRNMNIRSREEWYEKYKQLKIKEMPKHPQTYYKKEWKGWSAWNKNNI